MLNLHWGYDHTLVPAPFQRSLARRFARAGADLIIGHHPHVAQGWEVCEDTPVFYSLGNFNFWQFRMKTEKKHRFGYMVEWDPGTGSFDTIPYIINCNYQPVPLTGQSGCKAEGYVNGLCKALHGDQSKWFQESFRKWHSHELSVFTRRCREEKSLITVLKFLAWLGLPMNLSYYRYAFMNDRHGKPEARHSLTEGLEEVFAAQRSEDCT